MCHAGHIAVNRDVRVCNDDPGNPGKLIQVRYKQKLMWSDPLAHRLLDHLCRGECPWVSSRDDGDTKERQDGKSMNHSCTDRASNIQEGRTCGLWRAGGLNMHHGDTVRLLWTCSESTGSRVASKVLKSTRRTYPVLYPRT
eukprot:3548685-Amphidinium_carterae.1